MGNLSIGHGKTAVSRLQEMTQKRSAPVPVYKEKGGVGPPFTIVCQVDQLLTEGTGNSKKEAKRKAATSMLLRLMQKKRTRNRGALKSTNILSDLVDFLEFKQWQRMQDRRDGGN